MEVVRLDRARPERWPAPAVAVGNLDGVHRGHQALVAAAVEEAAALDGTSVVLTFEPHPSRVLRPERAPAPLMTLEQKAEVLAGLGVARLAVLEFTRGVPQQPAEEFARGILGAGLGARAVVVGSNFRFGRGRAGDAPLLERLGAETGFRVRCLEPVRHEDRPISSTRVREALEAGDVAGATALLGRRYFVDGSVVPGDGRGRTLGFPTANLDLVNEFLPALGVYACWARTLDDLAAPAWPAAVNVGRRPTFAGRRTGVEAHLIGFAGDLYGRRLRVEFLQRLREERRFAGPGPLREQIEADLAQARRVLRAP
jgi:riboflavin kinase/FMN adenylyltransferase